MRKLNLHKTRLTAVLLTLVLILGALPLTSEASFIPSHIAADTLNRLGLFKGSIRYEPIADNKEKPLRCWSGSAEQEAVAYYARNALFPMWGREICVVVIM